MQDQSSPIHAAIDIGSNTIHIVVARCRPDDLDILADEQELVRIGESVTATGAISSQKCDEAMTTLRKYQTLAQQYHAGSILVVATEAIRQATNSAKFLAEVLRETGLEVHLIDGNVEATLTFSGATYELYRELSTPALVGVMDLGGGSTEFVTAIHKHIIWRTSTPIGSGWLHDRYLSSNPPTSEDLAVAHIFLQTYFQGMRFKQLPPNLIVTGGSANSLLHLARHAFHLDEHETKLTRDDLTRSEELLNILTAEEVSQRYQQPPGRTRILPAGALIIRAVMDRLQLNEIHVSPHGIREGVLLSYARYGEEWLQQVQKSSEVPTQEKNGVTDTQETKYDETFAQSGRRLLLERTHKMLAWRDDVLKHEDIEAVHKMRVASRRLRAVLDAYESACDPKQFKKTYRLVKEIANILGKARDTDVMIENLRLQLIQAPCEEQAGIQWLIRRLDTYRQQHQQRLEMFLQKLDVSGLQEQVEVLLA